MKPSINVPNIVRVATKQPFDHTSQVVEQFYVVIFFVPGVHKKSFWLRVQATELKISLAWKLYLKYLQKVQNLCWELKPLMYCDYTDMKTAFEESVKSSELTLRTLYMFETVQWQLDMFEIIS